jgi:molecular chaperone Hsp33
MMIGAHDDNLLRPFRLERTALRGRVVRMGGLVDRVLTQHDYPEPVGKLLGEMFVLAATFAGRLEVAGTLSLQVKSDGPVSLMLADCTDDGAMRGYAQFDAERVAEADASLDGLLGRGHLALTVAPASSTETYQGVVELAGATMTECMQAYFRRSEQLKTGLRVAVEQVEEEGGPRWRAGGIMVQPHTERIAEELDGRRVREDWRRTMLYLSTVTDAELTDPGLTADGLLWRLFHEEGVRVFEPHELRFHCRCRRTRVEDLLRAFSNEQLEDMKEPDGQLVVTCQFCNFDYRFTESELADLRRPTSH